MTMGQFNHAGREQKMYVEDYPHAEVHPMNCVPSNRPNKTWTKGTLAWKKSTPTEPAHIVGWFTPPRFKKGKSLDRGSFRGLNDKGAEE